MKIEKISAFFAIVMGIFIIGTWIIFYVTDSIPELKIEPVRIGMHLLAEALTGLGLIMGGYGLVENKKWGHNIHLVSMGMLLYTLIISPGYYAEKRNYLIVGIFSFFFLVNILLIILTIFTKKNLITNSKD